MSNDTLEGLKKLMELGSVIGELKAELAAVRSERDWLRKQVEELMAERQPAGKEAAERE